VPTRDPDLAWARDHIRRAMRWGFRIEGRKRDQYGEGDNAIIMEMVRAECRFLR
jgi:hypothetical protein